jgi:hypothetical protein
MDWVRETSKAYFDMHGLRKVFIWSWRKRKRKTQGDVEKQLG